MGMSSAFATTRWSLVADAASPDPEARRAALGEFARLYQAPCEAWLRSRRGFGREQAEEIAQDFLVEVVLKRGLLSNADPASGPLRARVLRALRNHSTDILRRGAARERHESKSAERAADAGGDWGNDGAFDIEWAGAQLQEALSRVEARAAGSGRLRDWRAFERHVLFPAVYDTRRKELADLAREVGLADAARASVVIREMRMQVLRALDQVVTETARDPEDVRAELAHVREILGLDAE